MNQETHCDFWGGSFGHPTQIVGKAMESIEELKKCQC
jgi:hypothetical protein